MSQEHKRLKLCFRQMLVDEMGPNNGGQTRIAASSILLEGSSQATEIAARYLSCVGAQTLVVSTKELREQIHQVYSGQSVELSGIALHPSESHAAKAFADDDAVNTLFQGSITALQKLKEAAGIR